MDRLDEWRIFLSVAQLRSFSGAARALGRSPQAVTRAVAGLEARLGTRLLNRTTRSVSLSGDGERLRERGRRALAEIDLLESGERAGAELHGTLAVTAPVLFGQLHVAPVAGAFLCRHPGLDARLLLVDRVVALAGEGMDVGVRIGDLPDSSLRGRLLGHVRTVICASPAYLARAGAPRTPEGLAGHDCIAFTGTCPLPDRWAFPAPRGARRERSVAVHARLQVDTAQAAIDAAAAGLGVTRVLSYQIERLVAGKQLVILLAKHEPPPAPVHLVQLPGASGRAVAAFVGFATAELRARLGGQRTRRE